MQPFEMYEQVATFLLAEFAARFGLAEVQGKQTLAGKTTTWEIDAKGIKPGSEAFVVIECRRYTSSRLDQESVAGLAYRIHDLGAEGGIVVTPIGLQEGARRIAEAERIITVRLDPTSTRTDYVIDFLNQVMIGMSLSLAATAAMSFGAEVSRQCRACGTPFTVVGSEELCPSCPRTSGRANHGG